MLIYPLFHAMIFFTFPSSKLFQTGSHHLASFSPLAVSSPKQAAAVLTPAYVFPPIFYPLSRGPIFLDPIPPLLLHIKLPFAMSKQFSIDSFLD